jgi:hypothetical protein
MLARKKVDKQLNGIPHVVVVKINRAHNLKSIETVLTSTPPDSYVVLNVLRRKTKGSSGLKCFSGTKTDIIWQNYNPVWNEDVTITSSGPGYIVANIFSRGTVFTGDVFLGQAIIDMKLHPELFRGIQMTVNLPLKPAAFPVYTENGQLLKVPEIKGQGSISLSVEVPSAYLGNMCGWFTVMKQTFFDVVGENTWVVLHAGEVLCYDSPFKGVLRKQLSVQQIAGIEEIMYEKLEIPIETLKFNLSNEEEIFWGWKNDSTMYKGLWRRALKAVVQPVAAAEFESVSLKS